MEVGAVKQAFNNEVILLKKKLNQARIQIIHKLTRKAKQLAETKAPDPLKEKLKRKAESAVKEVLIIKKIKPKHLAQFIVTHKGELKDFLNKPIVDNDKACARLVLHKVLQDKYKFIRGRFSNVPIKDLFMSRLDRKRMQKEEKEKQKNNKKGKNNTVVNSEGNWNVEDVEIDKKKEITDAGDVDDELSDENGDESDQEGSESEEDNESQKKESEQSEAENESDKDVESISQDKRNVSESEEENVDNVSEEEANASESEEEHSESDIEEISKLAKNTSNSKMLLAIAEKQITTKAKPAQNKNIKAKQLKKKTPEQKQKDVNKNKNFNEKIQQKRCKKDSDAPIVGNKIVDPFFITTTGENYMSVVEPRGPDEVKDEHKQGNRKLRRAVMFGHVPKIKPRHQNNNYRDDNRFSKANGVGKGDNFRSKFNKQEFNDRKGFNNDFNDRNRFNDKSNDRKRFNDKNNDEKPEKLHPSWEAKKKKSGILPFEGKKIVFD